MSVSENCCRVKNNEKDIPQVNLFFKYGCFFRTVKNEPTHILVAASIFEVAFPGFEHKFLAK